MIHLYWIALVFFFLAWHEEYRARKAVELSRREALKAANFWWAEHRSLMASLRAERAPIRFTQPGGEA